jgi:hypothetical protein
LRGFLAVIGIAVAFGAVGTSVAAAGSGNPSGTGLPGQSCQDQLNSGGVTPGNSASSPGSPFNEPGFGNTPDGGNGGAHYSPTSQYDVACYHVSHKP